MYLRDGSVFLGMTGSGNNMQFVLFVFSFFSKKKCHMIMSEIQSLSRCIINFSKAVHFGQKEKKIKRRTKQNMSMAQSLFTDPVIIIKNELSLNPSLKPWCKNNY